MTRPLIRSLAAAGLGVVAAIVVSGAPVAAQSGSLGTFRWQLAPYCNVVTVTIAPQGNEFQVDGTDDQCGASRQATALGRAFPNPDGTIGFGFTVVTTPGGTPVHVDATIALPALSGTWRDSIGLSGAFTFTPGAGSGGPPRAAPPSGLPPASVTGASFAPGSIATTAFAGGVLPAALNAVPLCGGGQYLRGYSSAGRPVCQAFRPPTSVTLPYGLAGDPLAVVGNDGLPLIAHVDGVLGQLRMTKCHDVSCQGGATSTPITAMSPLWMAIDAGGLATVVGRGAGNGGGSSLLVLRCGDSACANANSVQNVADFYYERPAVVVGGDGLPAITYRGNVRGLLEFRQLFCGNSSCSSGNVDVPMAAPASGPTRIRTTRLTAAGQIVVVYETDYADPLRRRTYRATCDRSGCSQPSERPEFPIPPGTAKFGSDGLPVGLRGEYSGGGVVEVVHCDDPDCLTATTALADSLPGNYVGDFAHLGIGADGLPVISYKHSDLGALRVTHCGTVRCDAGNESATIDDPPFIVGHETFVLGGSDGFPLVLHRDSRTDSLRVTKCWSPTCQ